MVIILLMCTVEAGQEYSEEKDPCMHKKKKKIKNEVTDTQTDTHPDMVMQGALTASC